MHVIRQNTLDRKNMQLNRNSTEILASLPDSKLKPLHGCHHCVLICVLILSEVHNSRTSDIISDRSGETRILDSSPFQSF